MHKSQMYIIISMPHPGGSNPIMEIASYQRISKTYVWNFANNGAIKKPP